MYVQGEHGALLAVGNDDPQAVARQEVKDPDLSVRTAGDDTQEEERQGQHLPRGRQPHLQPRENPFFSSSALTIK